MPSPLTSSKIFGVAVCVLLVRAKAETPAFPKSLASGVKECEPLAFRSLMIAKAAVGVDPIVSEVQVGNRPYSITFTGDLTGAFTPLLTANTTGGATAPVSADFTNVQFNYAANILGNTARRILLFRDKATARRVCSTPEVADQLGDSGIEVCITADC